MASREAAEFRAELVEARMKAQQVKQTFSKHALEACLSYSGSRCVSSRAVPSKLNVYPIIF